MGFLDKNVFWTPITYLFHLFWCKLVAFPDVRLIPIIPTNFLDIYIFHRPIVKQKFTLSRGKKLMIVRSVVDAQQSLIR